MSLRRLTTLIVALVGGAGVALWLAQNFVNTWEPQLRARIEDGLSQSLQQRVHIDSVNLSFFNRFRIHNVQVWSTSSHAQLLFRADDVYLTVSLIDLPGAILRKHPIESLGLVSVHAPYLELSPEILARVKASHGTSAPSAIPLLFTLAWDGGTIHWNSATTGGYGITLHEAKGAFRIRGPKMDFAMRGRMDEAPLVRFELSSLRKHWWDARLLISDGDIPGILALAQTILNRPLVPAAWQTQGKFTLEVLAGGRHWPSPEEKPWNFIEKGHLSLSKASLVLGPGRPAIQCEGTVIGRESRWSADGLRIGIGRSVVKVLGSISPLAPNGPIDLRLTGREFDVADAAAALGRPGLAAGKAEAALSIRGTQTEPLIDLRLKMPEGRVALYPLKSADIQAHYEKRQWTLPNASTQLWGGMLQAKGNFSEAANTLKVSGENLSLAQMIPSTGTMALDGLLNFSGSLSGAWNDPEMTGSLWATHLSVGTSAPLNARGDIDISASHFEAQLASDDHHFQLALAGDHDDDSTTLEHLHVALPDGSTTDGHASWSAQGALSGELDAKDVPLPGLFLQLGRWTPGLSGTVSGHVKLSGKTEHPTLQGSLQSSTLAAGGDAFGDSDADFIWSSDRLRIPAFHIGSTIHGTLDAPAPSQPWTLRITAKDSPAETLMRLLAPRIDLPGTLSTSVDIHADGLDVREARYTSSFALANAKGRAQWSRSADHTHVDHVRFEAQGHATSPQEGLWEFPITVTGHWSPRDINAGEADAHVPSVKVRQKDGDPFDAVVIWDHTHVAWTHTHWGGHWKSEGSMHFLPESPAITARLDLADASASLAARWLGWLRPQEIDGDLSGTCLLNGTLASPSIEVNAHLKRGRWRAFRLDSAIMGAWKRTGDSSVGLTGTLDQGGPFTFRGVIHPNSSVEGNLQLNGLNLDALGQSLSFPQPLAGIVRGTLAVQGPIKNLQLAGHVEGGPMTYGAANQHPFRLENYFLDIAIAPSPDRSGFTRMTISKGIAKTAEEEIRLRNGSFAEFAAGQEARLAIGTDVRNLHLGVFTLFGGVDIDGLWQIKPAGFEIKGDVTTRSLFINDYELEQGHVNADYYDNVLRFSPPPKSVRLITGTIDFHNAPQLKFTDFLLSGREGQGLQLSGDIGPARWDFRMAGKGLDVGTLANLAGISYPLSGTADVTVRGTGDFTHPHLEGSLNLSQGSALGLAYATGQADFVWQNDRITFTQLTLSDPGRYKLLGTGSFPLVSQQGVPSHDPKINFSVRLVDSNLGLLQSLSNEVKKARGDVDGLLQITGTSDRPQLHGSVRVTNGDIIGAHYFKHLQNLLLSLDFAGDKIQLRELQGDSDHGTFLGGGTITLNGFIPSAYNLHADITSTKGLSVQVPELAIPESPLAKRFHFLTTISQADVKGHVTFQGPADSPVFKAQATISNGHFTFPASRKNPPPPALMEWFRRINWDVGLNFQDGAWFENEFVQASLIGNLKLKGPSDSLRVDGNMDISQGEISYLGLEFNIRQARFDVVSDESQAVVTNTPFVSGVAESQVQATDTLNGGGADVGNRLSFNDTITLTIDRAPVDEIKPRLTSANNPNLSQEKVLARATQIDMDNLTPQERTYVYQQQMIQVLDTGLATPLAKSFLKRTGLVDNFRVQRVIDPSGVSPVVASPNTPNALTPVSQNPFANTKYTVEKNLFNRVTVGYGVRFVPVLTPDLQDRLNLVSDVQLSYRWFKNVYVKGDVDLPNSNTGIVPERKVTIEPTFRFGWWGNTNAGKQKPARPAGPPALPTPHDTIVTPSTSTH